MNRCTPALLLVCAPSLAGTAMAQEAEKEEPPAEELELTMTLMEGTVRPAGIAGTIELPPPANARAAPTPAPDAGCTDGPNGGR